MESGMGYKDPEADRACKAAWYAAHREELLAKSAARNAANPGRRRDYYAARHASRRAEKAAYDAAYRVTNRERLVAAKAAYHASHQQEQAAKRAAYRAAHPREVKAGHAAWKANTEAARRGQTGRIKSRDVLDLWQRQPACLGCGQGCGVDHIIAFAGGGLNETTNLQNLCPACNTRKENRTVPHKRPEMLEQFRAAAARRAAQPGYQAELARRLAVGRCVRWRLNRGQPCDCGQHHDTLRSPSSR